MFSRLYTYFVLFIIAYRSGYFTPWDLRGNYTQRFSKYGLGSPRAPEALLGSPRGQNYFHNNAKTLYAFFTHILSQTAHGVFQRIYNV